MRQKTRRTPQQARYLLMIILKVKLNGALICTAGAEDLSVLNVIVDAIGKLGKTSKGAKGREDTYETIVRVGGLTSRPNPKEDEHLRWYNSVLKIGDQIEIEIGESNEADPPTDRSPAQRDNDQKRYFEWAKRYYLENKDKFE